MARSHNNTQAALRAFPTLPGNFAGTEFCVSQAWREESPAGLSSSGLREMAKREELVLIWSRPEAGMSSSVNKARQKRNARGDSDARE